MAAAVWWGLSALGGCAFLFIYSAVRFLRAAERMSEHDWPEWDEEIDREAW